MWLLTGVHFLFCRSSRLRTPSPLGQSGGLRDHSSGRGFCEQRRPSGQSYSQEPQIHPIQKSFTAPKYVIKAKDPRLQKITVAEHGFFFPKGSSAQQAAETEEERDEGEEQVIELDQSEDEFGAFDQFDPSEDPFGDTGDHNLSKVDFQGTSSQTDMDFKRKPSASLRDLLKGQPGKDTLGKSQPKLPLPPSKPQPP